MSYSLSESPARITAQYLVDQDVCGFRTNVPGTEPGWQVSLGVAPDTEDKAISIVETPLARNDGKLMNGIVVIKPGIQIRVRAADRDVAYRKASEVFDALSAVTRELVTVNSKSFRIDNCSFSTGIIFMGNDPGTERPNFVFDFYLTAKELEDD